ncbi:MAG: sulfatase [Candidatus Hydrogenedens sp.]|nr:sulfatase [Candidatus Hydrogenedentota bacterium]NLF57020.1 sulfatase [Candidatus Hydrogenedens sp.]
MDHTVSRRRFLNLMGASAAGCLLSGASVAQQAKRPNFVIILIDDMGRHQLGCYGNPFYETPNMDRLAAQGVKFMDAYAAAPVCSPTRASIMTGKYPARLHITDFIAGNPYPHAKLRQPDWQKSLPVEERTLAEMLGDAGYVSGHFGKWHLGVDKRDVPGRPGEPDTQGFDDILMREKPEGREAREATADPEYDAHHVREITDRAVAFLEKNRERPFFCHIAHSSIHQPVMAYGPDIIRYANKREAGNTMGNNPVIGAMVETLDRHVGRVLDALDALGLAENTVVALLSDNGDYFGREGLKPFYGAKADLYEGGIRVPWIMRWPGVTAPGTECAVPISTIDFFATFAELAGQAVADPEVDGVSITSLLRGGDRLDRDALYWHYPHYHSLGVGPSGAVREGRYKLIEWFEKSLEDPEAAGALELFDLEVDPGERVNLVREMPEKARDMHRKLVAWRAAVGAQEMTPNPDYDPARAEKSG